ncbi:MAG: alpha/beta hydrolase [Gemmatimonadota bacterium]|jgi:pimeloyl-ACP methyl ester carboxylesterase
MRTTAERSAAQQAIPLDLALLDSLRALGAETADPAGFCRAYWRVEGPRTTGDPAAAALRTCPCDLANVWTANLERWGQGVFASLGDWDWTADASAAEMPALIVHGTRDLMVPMAAAEEWASVLPRATLFSLAGAGHVPWWEYEDVLFPTLDSFLIG